MRAPKGRVPSSFAVPALAAFMALVGPGGASAAEYGAWRARTGEDFMSGARTGLAVHATTTGAGRTALTVGCSADLPLRAMYAPGARLGAGAVALQYRVDGGAVREVDGFPGSDGTAVIVLDDAFVPRLLAGRAVRLRATDARGVRHDAEFALDGLRGALAEACGWSESFRALAAGPEPAASGETDLAATFLDLSRELAATPGTSAPTVADDTLETVAPEAARRGADSGPGPETSDARTAARRDDPPGTLDRDGAVLRREVQLRLREATGRWKSRLREAILPHAALDPSGCAALVEVDPAGQVGAVSVEGCPEREARALRRAIDVAAPLPLPTAKHVWRPRVGLAFR